MSTKFIGFFLEFYIIIIIINSLAKHFLLRKQRKQEETPPFLFPPNVVLRGRSDGRERVMLIYKINRSKASHP